MKTGQQIKDLILGDVSTDFVDATSYALSMVQMKAVVSYTAGNTTRRMVGVLEAADFDSMTQATKDELMSKIEPKLVS